MCDQVLTHVKPSSRNRAKFCADIRKRDAQFVCLAKTELTGFFYYCYYFHSSRHWIFLLEWGNNQFKFSAIVSYFHRSRK